MMTISHTCMVLLKPFKQLAIDQLAIVIMKAVSNTCSKSSTVDYMAKNYSSQHYAHSLTH